MHGFICPIWNCGARLCSSAVHLHGEVPRCSSEVHLILFEPTPSATNTPSLRSGACRGHLHLCVAKGEEAVGCWESPREMRDSRHLELRKPAQKAKQKRRGSRRAFSESVFSDLRPDASPPGSGRGYSRTRTRNSRGRPTGLRRHCSQHAGRGPASTGLRNRPRDRPSGS